MFSGAILSVWHDPISVCQSIHTRIVPPHACNQLLRTVTATRHMMVLAGPTLLNAANGGAEAADPSTPEQIDAERGRFGPQACLQCSGRNAR